LRNKKNNPAATSNHTIETAEYRRDALAVRSVIGGALMGLANLVPGLSGGTMLLAVGVYPQFINSIADVSTFRLRRKSVLTLACVIGAAALAVVMLAGPIGQLVVHRRWIMYSLFIGLTLGGVPVLWRMVKPVDTAVVLTAIIGIALMAVLAIVEPHAAGESDKHAYAMLILAGIAGGAAMILPGVSGGYLLLILGQYVVILSTIDALRAAGTSRDWAAAAQTLHVLVPVGLGVLIGIVGVSNGIKILLAKYERPTLGVLLGLLLGAVIGLWPFQHAVEPQVGDVINGETLTTPAMVDAVKPEDWPSMYFMPDLWQVAAAIGLIGLGFAVAVGVSHLGREKASAHRNG